MYPIATNFFNTYNLFRFVFQSVYFCGHIFVHNETPWQLLCMISLASRPWRIALVKVAYYATSSARNFAKLCQTYARIPKLCS